jgi:radical SAM protein with 4Fe4S-binding SPASM domain
MSALDTKVALPLPRFVQIEPVGQCNLACRMCPVAYRADGGPGTGKPPAFMSFEAFRRVLDQFPAMSELHLQGMGEPMLHPRFFDMVRAAAARGIEVSTNSNLTALSRRRAEECVSSGLKRLHASLDAASPGTYEFIRVGARFDRVVRNLDWLLEARRGNPRGLEIVLVAVAMRRNLKELPALVRFAHGRGIEAVSVQHLAHDFTESTLPERYRPMRAFVDAETLLAEDPLRVERGFGEARELAAALGVELRLPNPRPRPHPRTLKGPARCDWPWRRAYVSYSGEAMPCCMVATPDRASFGNMAHEGVEAVWNNEAYRRFREKLDSRDPPEICKGCAVYNGTF